jgi:hypothetical protein
VEAMLLLGASRTEGLLDRAAALREPAQPRRLRQSPMR